MPTLATRFTTLFVPALLTCLGVSQVASAQGQGPIEFVDSGQALGNSNSQSVALGDLDGDGDLDAMVANFNQPSTVWTNDGTGTFTDSGQALGDSQSRSVSLGDLDGDGDLDAMVANAFQPDTVWTNEGNGTFINPGQAIGNSDSQSIAFGDLDGDGELDAMVANSFAQPNNIWINEASNISAVYNVNSELWFDSAREAITLASADDTLLIGGASFDVPGVIDARDLPLTFVARSEVTFAEELMFLPGAGSRFLSFADNARNTYASSGRIIAPENGELIFNALDFLDESQFQQNGCSLLVNGQMETTGGVTYLSGEVLAVEISTGINGVNRVSDDTDFFGDYVNAGSTIIQRGILYIYGDLTNTGTMTGDFNNGFLRGVGPEEGDGYSIGGAYTIGAEASLVLPESLWRLSVGGNLDIAIDDPARFAMAQATIELNGLAPGTQQTMETLSADLGASDIGFASSNFPIGTLRVASGSNTVLANAHVNSTDTPCEVLYVDRLVVEAGASLTTAGCRIYTNEAVINGSVDNDDDIIVINDCPADIDGDGVVNGPDLAAVLAAWGSSTPVADFNGDGQVDGQDLAVILAAWGSCTE